MTESTGLIYLQQDKFDFYQPAIGKIIEFGFVTEIIKDLEIINVDLLDNLIKVFVTNNKIVPGELVMVIADNACFIKDFILPSVSSETKTAPTDGKNPVVVPVIRPKISEDEIKSFIEHVPFENVLSKTFDLASGTKVIALNKDMYEAIKSAFEKLGFKINFVLPGVVFENNIGSVTVLNLAIANNMLTSADLVKEQNLLIKTNYVSENHDFKKQDEPDSTKKQPVKKSNKRLFLMIGIFVVLIIILVFVYLGSIQTPAK